MLSISSWFICAAMCWWSTVSVFSQHAWIMPGSGAVLCFILETLSWKSFYRNGYSQLLSGRLLWSAPRSTITNLTTDHWFHVMPLFLLCSSSIAQSSALVGLFLWYSQRVDKLQIPLTCVNLHPVSVLWLKTMKTVLDEMTLRTQCKLFSQGCTHFCCQEFRH